MFPVLQVGPMAIQVPGLFLLIGLWFGLTQVEKAARRTALSINILYNLVMLALFSGLIGGRLAYAGQYPQAFSGNWLSLLSITPTLFDPLAGVVIALLAGAVYSQKKRLPFWPLLDTLAPGMAIMAIAIGLAHLASGSAFGTPTDVAWAIQLWGAQRHPSQVYEIAAALLIFFAVISTFVRFHHLPGFTFLSFTGLSAFARLFLEAFRGDSTLLVGGVRSAQVIAWLILAASLFLLGQRVKNVDTHQVEQA